MSRMDDDLFTYKVEISGLANILCDLNEEDDLEQQMTHGSNDGLEYDPSNVEFTEWLASKFYNHGTMDWYTKNALWIYWARGDDEVELSDKESSDSNDENLIDENEVAEIFWIETNVFDFETPTSIAFKQFNYLSQIDPDVPTKYIDGFNTYDQYKDDWIYEWNKDVPWVYEKLWTDNGAWKEPTHDDYEEANSNGEEREYKNEQDDEERHELCDDDTQELPVWRIKRYMMIKYSFGGDEKYVAIKEDEYDDFTSTSEETCHA
ncbi:hypothetical protein Tco_0925945 [Tanacetum coccineum]|uniref:Uncharacterized protein n=1 Tax=Tanacetum coccineum TaxID=301880 RepID=A0ABQ5D8B3_9ASTR